MGKVCAVVTAGGRVATPFAAVLGTEVKALAPLGGRRLIDPVIDAVRGSGAAGLAVVGPPAVRVHCAARVDRFIDAVPSGVENIALALRAFPDADRLVFLASDLPFIDAGGLRGFVEASDGYGLTMALAPGAAYFHRFPGAPRHTVRFHDTLYANGSAFTIAAPAVDAVARVAGRFFSARKSLPRLAALLGAICTVRFVLRTLTIADIERRASHVLGASAHAIVNADPGLCFDVDDLTDWRYANRLIAVYG